MITEMGKVNTSLVKAGLAETIDFGKDFDKAKTLFNASLEAISTGELKQGSDTAKAYDKAIDLYEKLNPETPVQSKGKAAKDTTGKGKGTGNTKALAAAREKVDRDVFGFGVSTKASQFGKMLLNGGCTMKEVRDAKWNDTKLVYPRVFKGLVEKGLAELAKDGVTMKASKSAIKAAGK